MAVERSGGLQLALLAMLGLVVGQSGSAHLGWLQVAGSDVKLSRIDCDPRGQCVEKYERVSSPTDPPSFFRLFFDLFKVTVPVEKRPWGTSVAFLVGVAEYDHIRPQLPYVHTDLEDLRSFLLREGGFDLVFVARDRIVSEKLINTYMRQKLPRELSERDRLLFYYSGHGADLPGTDSGYMLFSNAQPEDFSAGVLRIRSAWEEWSGVIPAKHALFIFDACASGMGFEPKSWEGSSQAILASLSGGGSRHVMTAGTAEEKVYQIELSSQRGHSVFTAALLEALRTGFSVQREDGFLLTSDLISGVQREVARHNAKYPGRKMTPRLWSIPRESRIDRATGRQIRDDGDFVFLNLSVKEPDLSPDYRTILNVPPKGSKELAELDSQRHTVLNLGSGVEIEFAEIKAGRFEMGSDSGDDDEKPVRTVEITRGFQLGKYEMTQKQWETVMGVNPSYFKGDQLPVENVSWDNVQEFLKRLNDRLDGWSYRLPTEAEWEYAARAGTIGDYAGNLEEMAWFGDNSGRERIDTVQVWFGDQNSDNYVRRLLANGCSTHPVGGKKPNAWGLFDMHGNVWEWVWDGYRGDYYSRRPNPDRDPQGPEGGWSRVIRGGSWGNDARKCRLAERFDYSADKGTLSVGFRFLRQPK